MEIIEVGSGEYAAIINAPYFIFGSSAFNDLNRSKCDELFFLLFKEGNQRIRCLKETEIERLPRVPSRKSIHRIVYYALGHEIMTMTKRYAHPIQ